MPTGTPTYLTVNPDGTVTAVFTGGVQMPETAFLLPIPSSAISWTDTAGKVWEFIQGIKSSPTVHTLLMWAGDSSFPLTSDYIELDTQSGGTPVQQKIVVSAGGIPKLLLDGNAESDFMERVSAVSQPGRVLGTVYQPNMRHDTLVVANIGLASAGGGTENTVSINVGVTNPPATTQFVMTNKFFGAGDTPEIIVPATFIVPKTWYYQIFVSVNNAAVAGFPNITSVTEVTI